MRILKINHKKITNFVIDSEGKSQILSTVSSKISNSVNQTWKILYICRSNAKKISHFVNQMQKKYKFRQSDAE